MGRHDAEAGLSPQENAVTGGPGLREEQAGFGGVVRDEDMYDVTNLSTRRTGLRGVVYCSTAQGQHGPRVKWYPGRPGRETPCLVVTLESPPRTINQGLPPRVARDAEHATIAWVELNRDALLGYWNDGLGWTEEEHDAFLDGLRKLP
ncbi:hypothetical protein [Falsiroseomonas sp. HW251]|uniref:hypothetical protein n=1 Tax=Falsiroseomonas sp. HW251 TaxID=3390998 RepID=UPI003D31AE61